METANLPGSEKQKTVEQLLCSAGLYFWNTRPVDNCFGFKRLSISAFLRNALVLAALGKEYSLHPPSNSCFVAFQQLISVLVLLHSLFWLPLRDPTLCEVSMLTLTAISVRRLLALLLGLRYEQVVTLKRTYVIVIAFWVIYTVFSTMRFWNASITSWYTIIVIFLCLVTSTFSYTKIFLTLRHRQNQVQDQAQQPNQTNQMNIARYRKAVSSALWLQLTLLACYLPFYIGVAFTVGSGGLSTFAFLVWCYTGTLIFLNSSLNPILYCWKMD